MAGRGTRLRPHTLTIPKPLIPVAGKPIIQRLVEDLAASYKNDIEEIAYIVGDFGPDIEQELIRIAENLGARGRIYQQDKALGVGHAIACASESMEGKCMVAFADTLFQADFSFDAEEDGVIWTQKVEDPSSFGVVKLDGKGYITEFVEKPSDFISDLAIVGIYYFREGERLRAGGSGAGWPCARRLREQSAGPRRDAGREQCRPGPACRRGCAPAGPAPGRRRHGARDDRLRPAGLVLLQEAGCSQWAGCGAGFSPVQEPRRCMFHPPSVRTTWQRCTG